MRFLDRFLFKTTQRALGLVHLPRVKERICGRAVAAPSAKTELKSWNKQYIFWYDKDKLFSLSKYKNVRYLFRSIEK